MGSQPEPSGLHLLPWPQSVDRGSGALVLSSARLAGGFDRAGSARMGRALDRLSEDIARKTGLPLTDPTAEQIRIRCDRSATVHPGIEEDESYWLVVDDAGVFLDAASEWGVLRGLVTLGQLVSVQGTIPHVAIDDRPRFGWRGLLLDPARHFLPVEALLRTLDGMAHCKLNVLHLHLSDDQGFRFPVTAYPRLASDLAYTTADLARVVAHAADLGIRVVPEIDMPGHVTSWLTAYPQWGARQVAATDRFGVHGACLDPSNAAVYEAIGDILDALVAVFPDPCLHIGGDEVSPGWWSEDPGVAELMRRESLTTIQQVQGYFNRRVGALVADRGRQPVAWDEVLADELPANWIVQAWRGATARDRALARGHRVVQSAPYYLDLHYPIDVHYGTDPAQSQEALCALEDALLIDERFSHVADGIRWTLHWREQGQADRQKDAQAEAVVQGRLLGAEACLWGELVTEDVLDVRLWTRLPALAERFWSAADRQNLTDLHRRLDWYLETQHPLRGRDLSAWTASQLDRLGIDPPWRELVAMLEPVKWYGRLLGAEALAARIEGREMPKARPYSVNSTLDGLVDHLPPESRLARHLAGLCEQIEQGNPAAAREVAQLVERWQLLEAQAPAAPAGLQTLAVRLAELGRSLDARLNQRQPLEARVLDRIVAPLGELMISMPPVLRRWLTSKPKQAEDR